MGLNSLLNIASSSINMERVALEVTSENIANVNTPGYSRQQTILETAPVTMANGFPLGTGVQLAAVQRNYDGLLQQQIVNGNSTDGKDSTLLTALQQVEPSFNEVTTNGLGQALTDFFNAWQDLSTNPQGAPERQALMARAQVLTDTFHQMNTSLTNVANDADNQLTGITSDISDKAKSIASLNTQIATTERLGGNANELRDQRDLLLQQLGQDVGISYTEQSDGTVTVTLPKTSAGGGETIVSGNQYATVYTDNTGGTTSNSIYVTAIGNPPPASNPAADTDVTATIGGPNDATKAPDNSLGKIGGALQIRNSIVGGSGGYLARLDEMAKELVTAVNGQHQLGYGTDGVNGRNFFDPADTTSANIQLDAGLNTTTIAAAGGTVGAGDNTNALAMADLGSSSIGFTVNGNTTNATFNSYYDAFVSSVGVDVQSAQNASDQSQSFLKQLNSLRDSNSGVSLDEELTNLVKYQQAFQASAKLINTATNMMDTLLGMVQ